MSNVSAPIPNPNSISGYNNHINLNSVDKLGIIEKNSYKEENLFKEILLCLKNVCTKEDSKIKTKKDLLINDYSFYFNSFGNIKDIKIHSNSLYIQIDLNSTDFEKKKKEMIDGVSNKNINGTVVTVIELTKDDFFPS